MPDSRGKQFIGVKYDLRVKGSIRTMLILTEQDILNDISDYEIRIQNAKDKLASLPEGPLPFSQHKKREAARRILQDEIRHVRNLTSIAEEALNEN